MATNIETKPLEIIRGDDEALEITVKDGDNENANMIKAGTKFWLTVKRNILEKDSKAIFTDDYDVEEDTETFVIDLSNTETELPLGTYYSDIQFRDEFGKIKTIYRGSFIVSYDVTRRKT